MFWVLYLKNKNNFFNKPMWKSQSSTEIFWTLAYINLPDSPEFVLVLTMSTPKLFTIVFESTLYQLECKIIKNRYIWYILSY